ncbi:MAG: translation initiation factor IF-3 [Magnetococcales bacterium]|nr:translation initiation factor IF-3 [Magnetococcales bacterium]
MKPTTTTRDRAPAPASQAAPAVSPDTTRINEQIRVPEVRLIDEKGQQVGVISTYQALARAIEAGQDLVEVAPEARPPVCKIMDYAKFKYQKAVRERQARKKQVRIEIKEIKFRPGTDTHDFDVKLRSMRKFLEEDGDKVKCTLRFRGREMAHQELGLALLKRVEEALSDVAKVEQPPKLMGRQITMVVAPSQSVKTRKVPSKDQPSTQTEGT